MCNEEIIATSCKLNGINEVCHTYAEWKRIGKQVRKGEKAKFKTAIWMLGKRKHKTTDVEKEELKEDESYFYLKDSCFFAESQVEDIKADDVKEVA